MGDALHTHGGVTSALEARLADAGLLAVAGATPLDVRTGVLFGPGTTQLVTGTAATAPMQVAVAPHQWVTSRGAANGPYRGSLDATQLVNIAAAPASGSRIDVVYVKQQDAQPGIPTPDATTAPLYGVVQGVETTGTPAKPALPIGAEELATVVVAAGAVATNGAGVTISNTSRQTVARGVPIPVRSAVERDAITKFPGLEVRRLDVAGYPIERWTTGTTWVNDTARIDALQRVAPTAMTLTTDFTDWGFGYRPLCYWREGRSSYAAGAVRLVAALGPAVKRTIATFPTGHRPSLTVPSDGINVPRVQVLADGQIQLDNASSSTLAAGALIPVNVAVPLD